MSGPSTGEPTFTVVIATRNRAEQVLKTLDALDRQTGNDFDVVIVDQSDSLDKGLESRVEQNPRLDLIRDHGRGLSRARNLGWRAVGSDWVVFLDDDCVPEQSWAEELARVFAERADISFVAGHVAEREVPQGDYLRVSVFEVAEERVSEGRWTKPWAIGLGVCMAVRRSMIGRLGGFDERLGTGSAEFPASDDMDFNYRFLQAGGRAYATPKVRAFHDQWRTTAELPALYRGYMLGWSAFAAKTLRRGNVLGGVWLWWAGVNDVIRMLASALRRRSRLRLRVALAKFRGLATGTVKGLARSW